MQAETRHGKPLSSIAVAIAFVFLLIAWLAILWPLPKGFFKESDTYWLIEVGNNILLHRALPSCDPYSFASLRTPWILYQWFFEVVLALANTLGLMGVSILGEVTLTLLFCVLLFRRMIKLGVNSIVACIVIAIAMHATYPDVATLRPQLFSFVLLFFLQTILEDVWSGITDGQQMKRLLTKTLVIGVFWANCHVSFPLGLLMIAIYLGGAVVRAVMNRGEDNSRMKIFVWMGIVFFFATFINPYGPGLWSFLITVRNSYATQEVQALDWSHSRLYIIVYSMMLVSSLYLWKSAARPRLVLAFVLFVIGCIHARLIIYFCLSTCPLVGQAVSAMLPKVTRSRVIAGLSESMKVVAFKRYYPIVVIAISVIVVCSQPYYISRSVPLKAAEYLASHRVAGNLFCSAQASSYLIYRFHGAIKIFIDTRIDLYDPALCSRYVAAMSGSGWKELFEEYKIAETLLPKTAPLFQAIEQSPDWQRTYEDDDFAISTRRSQR
jgi:hypothetical protein